MQANLQWLDDPEVFRVNQLPAHSDHHYYHDAAEIKTGSRFVKSLMVLGASTLPRHQPNAPLISINRTLMRVTSTRFKSPATLNSLGTVRFNTSIRSIRGKVKFTGAHHTP